MSEMTPQMYYASHSRITAPGDQSDVYAGLPGEIGAISQIVQGLVLHYMADRNLYDYPRERTGEIDTRYVPDILRRIRELDDRPLSENRPPSKRFVGCCRDFTVLAISMLRQHGIPARARHGFAAYFVPDHYIDHAVVEFWNGSAWQLADSEISQQHFPFNVLNVPRDQFIVGGKAWQMCRSGQADPERFGLGPGVPVCGWWFIQGRMLQDLAALNKHEMLCWDEWSYGMEDAVLTDDDRALLDHLAKVTQQGDAGFAEVQRLFGDEPRLKLPNPFMSFSPAQERLISITLR